MYNPEPNSLLDPEWIAILVALLLGIAGIFQDWVRSLFKRPTLDVTVNLAPPDCHKTSMRNTNTDAKVGDAYYIRFKVTNSGNYRAEDTEAMITNVRKKNDSGEFVTEDNFLPLNLVWSHYRYTTVPKIQPQLFKFLDFGHIMKSNAFNSEYLPRFGINTDKSVFLELEVDTRPNNGSFILLPGEYLITIVYAGNNVHPKEVIYRLVFNDKWDDNEKLMLSNNIKITEELVTGL